MKAFLTEWLIMYGTGVAHVVLNLQLVNALHLDFIERAFFTNINDPRIRTYKITPAGIAFLEEKTDE